MLLCKLTDLELSGAPQLATREADRARPTRPLERLVRRQDSSAPFARIAYVHTSLPARMLTRGLEGRRRR